MNAVNCYNTINFVYRINLINSTTQTQLNTWPMKFLINFTFLFCLSTGVFAQASPGWRLTSFSMEAYDGTAYRPTDSGYYYYSGNHQGKPDFYWLENLLRGNNYRSDLYKMEPALVYDSLRAYRGSTGGGYINANLLYAQTLNGNLITGRTRYSSGNVTSQETYTYNSSNMLTEKVTGNAKTQYHYNAAQLTDTAWEYVYNSVNSTWELASTMYWIYNPNNQLISARKDIAGTAGYFKYEYHFNSTGLMDTILLLNGGPQPEDTFKLYAYAYNGPGDLVTELLQVTDGPGGMGGNMQNWDFHKNTYGNNHNKTEDLIFNWNSTAQQWDTFGKWTYTYTPAGLVESFESLRWDAVNGTWAPMMDTTDARTSHRMHLYYDIVWPVSVTNNTPVHTDMRLYPNPAAGVITLSLAMEKTTSVTARITDMQGRVLMQWNEGATKQYTRTIPLTGMPAGSYMLQVQGEGISEAKVFVVQ